MTIAGVGFSRTKNGNVKLSVPGQDDRIIPQGDWASIVAHVSKMPDNLARPTMIALHNMEAAKGYQVLITLKKAEM